MHDWAVSGGQAMEGAVGNLAKLVQVANNRESGWTRREALDSGDSAEQDARDDNDNDAEGWVVVVIHFFAQVDTFQDS